MAFRNLLFFSFFSIFLLQLQPSISQTTVKAAYWFPASEFPVSDINSALFTHLFCAFAALDPQSNQLIIPNSSQAAFAAFTTTVQQKNPSVQTLLSIGGGRSDPSAFASMASQPTSRKSFIDSSIRLARANGFYGLDLDWEYPQTPQQMLDLGTLFNEWRAAVVSESQSSGQTQLLLTAAVHFSANRDSLTYPVQSIGTNLDWVNVMAYDFKGPDWSGDSTGAPAALYDPSSRFSGSAGIDVWIGAGLSTNKMVLGLPFYGYAWKLVDPNQNGLGAPANGSATEQDVGGDGSISYWQIKAFIERTGATWVYDSTVVTDYCYAGSTWIGFDGVRSVAAKVSYAKSKGLLGYFAWSVGGDSNWELSQTASGTWDGLNLSAKTTSAREMQAVI
ncbi:class V chitinase-like isoform X1 [Magnolia sinica]|uniref:class V chitinase-like isoform X1 n=1 Tax=Magnolia sinica TaxID=86752 RepID=UPI00265A842E|nr:class V chitinase-like isoform X1 [Magnolia sinica]